MNDSSPTVNRNIVLGISGSIAAYKGAELARLCCSWGYEVRVVMTSSAQEFISPLTMQAISGNEVTTSFWDDSEISGIGHISLADWADAVVIAPATADIIAKLAHGFAESPLLAVALATKAPIIVAPAMNVNMYENTVTQDNLEILKKRGVVVVDPEEGALACGWNGAGRLASPDEIFYHIRRAASEQDYIGKKVLITTGPTREAIDPVRFISNRSSGKMGIALAREAFRRGANVTLVHGPIEVKTPPAIKKIPVVSAQEMHKAVVDLAFDPEQDYDLVIMAAAVSDYQPKEVSDYKLKKADGLKSINLMESPDILAELGRRRGDGSKPILVGFAVETGEPEELIQEVRRKLHDKSSDMIVGNLARDAFEGDTNRVWLVDKGGRQDEVSTTYKSRIAAKILDAIKKL